MLRQLGGLLLILTAGALTPAATASPLISIIIDDLGDNADETLAAIHLPGPVACAFLPGSPHTLRLARVAHDARKEVLVHLPLEPGAGRAHPMALSSRQDADTRTTMLGQMLDAVPFAVGVNNHQGSRATTNRGTMHWLMRELSGRGTAYFVDSMTSADSIAYPMARAYGIPATRRRVFLDHERGADAVRAQFERLVRIARNGGGALAIGHPYPETLAMLSEVLPALADYDVELVTPSQLIRAIENRPPIVPVTLRLATSLSPTQHASPLSATAAAVR